MDSGRTEKKYSFFNILYQLQYSLYDTKEKHTYFCLLWMNLVEVDLA